MSSETYYSPRLSAERAAAIIAECNSIINKTMSQREFVEIRETDINLAVAKAVISQGTWQEKDNAFVEKEVGNAANVTYTKTNSRGHVIDDSSMLKGRLSAVQEKLTKCIPKTVADRKKKTQLMSELYGEKSDSSYILDETEVFCEEQTHVSDEQQQIVDKYFALLELLGYPQEKFSIEEMDGDIDRLYEIFVKREERNFIRCSIYEVFEKNGYHIDGSKWMDETSCDVKVSNLRNAQCRITSTGDDFLLESYGVVNHAGTVSTEDRKCMLRDERQVCEINLRIEEELEEKGVVFSKMYSIEPSEENLVFDQVVVAKDVRMSEDAMSGGKA